MACSAQKQPLCRDGSDMADSLCHGKCYTRFPDKEDPYRWPCVNGTKRCILQTSLCDGVADCDDGTELSYSSDEQNCPLVTRIGLNQSVLISLAIVAFAWVLYVVFIAFTHLSEQNQAPIIDSEPTSLLEQAVPSFLLHPALSDMDNQSWNWQEVGEQLKIETLFFNKDPQVIIDFLYHIEVQDAKPINVYNAFQGFSKYQKTKGYDFQSLAVHFKKTTGHHKLAHMALKGPPNFIDESVYKIRKCLNELETMGNIHLFLVRSLRAAKNSIPSFLLYLDYVKDIILCLIMKETLLRLQESCENISTQGFHCLDASGTEQDLILALFVVFCISITLTSINSFFLRKRFFKTNRWLNFVFGIVSPLLPAIFYIRISQMKHELDNKKKELDKKELERKEKEIEKLTQSVQQLKAIEVGLEAVMQILLLLGLACFGPYVFKAPSGRTYSYFYGVTLLVLKGNRELYFASVFISFLGPCMFYANYTNILRHGSLNFSRKLVFMTRNVVFLLVRVLAITSSIFIPVISQWNSFVGNYGSDASLSLDWPDNRIEFERYFSKGLDILTADIRKNAQFFVLFLLAHLVLVASNSVFHSAKFGSSMMRERLIHLISSFWLPLPFLTIRGADLGEEKAELWFLVALHSLENFFIVLISRLVYLQESYPLGIVTFDCVCVLLNLMGVSLSIFYVSKIELYAGLPEDESYIPTYNPEVSEKFYVILKNFFVFFRTYRLV